MKNILVPIDFSRLSLHALHHAERLAINARAGITLLHVIEPYVDVLVRDSAMLAAAARVEKELQTESAKRLQKIANALSMRTKLRVGSRVLIGSVGRTIRRTAADTRADLIIMGTHGVSGFFESLIGSNTYRVATLSRVPVMSVHRRMRAEGYKHIIYLVRVNVRAMNKMPYAIAFAKLFNAQIHILGLLHSEKAHQHEMRLKCKAIKDRIAENGVTAKISFTFGEEFAEAAMRYTKKYSGALMVINQDDDFRIVEMFTGTFTKRVFQKALVPVLSVPR